MVRMIAPAGASFKCICTLQVASARSSERKSLLLFFQAFPFVSSFFVVVKAHPHRVHAFFSFFKRIYGSSYTTSMNGYAFTFDPGSCQTLISSYLRAYFLLHSFFFYFFFIGPLFFMIKSMRAWCFFNQQTFNELKQVIYMCYDDAPAAGRDIETTIENGKQIGPTMDVVRGWRWAAAGVYVCVCVCLWGLYGILT